MHSSFSQLSELITCLLAFPALVLVSLYYSFKLKGLQFTRLLEGTRILFGEEKKEQHKEKKTFSHFQVVAAILAGNLGTGNISGMAIALKTGGPGALFWMWVLTPLCSIIQYVSSYLGVKFRTQKQGEDFYRGGPMYYMKQQLSSPLLAFFFCLSLLLAGLTVGNLAQVDSMLISLDLSHRHEFFFLSFLSLFTFAVLFTKRNFFARFASMVVPLMAMLFFLMSLSVIFFFRENLLPSLMSIIQSAFSYTPSLTGAMKGVAFSKIISVGLDRSIFATDTGLGLGPIIQANVTSKGPHKEGLVALVAPYFVIFICTLTALSLMVTGAWKVEGIESSQICLRAFESSLFGVHSTWILKLIIIFFGITTISSWSYCYKQALLFMSSSKKVITFFSLLFVATIFMGASSETSVIWELSDLAITMMLLCNLYAIFRLRREF